MTVPEHVASYAAGLFTYDPEIGWDRVAVVVERLGLGRYSADELAGAAKLWAGRNGTDLSALTMKIAAAKEGGTR